MQFLTSFSLILAGVGLTMIGDVFLKKSQLTDYWYIALGVLFYTSAIVPAAIVFKKIDFGPVLFIWEALTVISAIIIASFYFHESFTVSKCLALLFALLALYFSYR